MEDQQAFFRMEKKQVCTGIAAVVEIAVSHPKDDLYRAALHYIFINTYHPTTPTEGGSLFLQTAFSEQNHSKKIVGVIRVNPFVDWVLGTISNPGQEILFPQIWG